jgi:hypothetical protein
MSYPTAETERLESGIAAAIVEIKAAQEMNAGLQRKTESGSESWHAHESIDDRLHAALGLLGD